MKRKILLIGALLSSLLIAGIALDRDQRADAAATAIRKALENDVLCGEKLNSIYVMVLGRTPNRLLDGKLYDLPLDRGSLAFDPKDLKYGTVLIEISDLARVGASRFSVTTSIKSKNMAYALQTVVIKENGIWTSQGMMRSGAGSVCKREK